MSFNVKVLTHLDSSFFLFHSSPPGIVVVAKIVARDGGAKTAPAQHGTAVLRGAVGKKLLRLRGATRLNVLNISIFLCALAFNWYQVVFMLAFVSQGLAANFVSGDRWHNLELLCS